MTPLKDVWHTLRWLATLLAGGAAVLAAIYAVLWLAVRLPLWALAALFVAVWAVLFVRLRRSRQS